MPNPTTEKLNFGRGIRTVRQRRGLTVTQLAKTAELSPSAISQIENGINEPSLGTLRRIAKALDVPMFAFLADDRPSDILVRKASRRKLSFSDRRLILEILTPDSAANLEMFVFTLPPGEVGGPEPQSHPGDECTFVLKGTLELEIEHERYVLHGGDSIYIHAGLLHLARNIGKEIVEAVVAMTPAKY